MCGYANRLGQLVLGSRLLRGKAVVEVAQVAPSFSTSCFWVKREAFWGARHDLLNAGVGFGQCICSVAAVLLLAAPDVGLKLDVRQAKYVRACSGPTLG